MDNKEKKEAANHPLETVNCLQSKYGHGHISSAGQVVTSGCQEEVRPGEIIFYRGNFKSCFKILLSYPNPQLPSYPYTYVHAHTQTSTKASYFAFEIYRLPFQSCLCASQCISITEKDPGVLAFKGNEEVIQWKIIQYSLLIIQC